MKLQALIDFMEAIFPLELAEEWDNVGLLLGARESQIKKVMTCLTVNDAVVDEAIEFGANVIISHHPFPFHSSKKWTSDTTAGRLTLRLLGAQIAVYSPHTAHDSAFFGINRQLAEGLGLMKIESLYEPKIRPNKEMLAGLDKELEKYLSGDLRKKSAALGAGRIGRFRKSRTLGEFVALVKDMLQIERALVVGEDSKKILRVAIGCGAAEDFIDEAAKKGADVVLTGEARFHACEEARARDVAVVLAGHYATERFSAQILAERIERQFSDLTVKASVQESDPIRII